MFHFDFSLIITYDNKRGFIVNAPFLRRQGSTLANSHFISKHNITILLVARVTGDPNPRTPISPGQARRICHPVSLTPVHMTFPTPTFFAAYDLQGSRAS
jgi:hypothetical protein